MDRLMYLWTVFNANVDNTIIVIIVLFYFIIIVMLKFQYHPSLICNYVAMMLL